MFRKVRKGEVYRAINDVSMLGLVILRAAGSGGFQCVIPKGTRIVVESDPSWPWPISKGTYVLPLNYKELEQKVVPLKERQFFKYKGYALHLDFKQLPNFIKEEKQKIIFDDKIIQKEWDENSTKE